MRHVEHIRDYHALNIWKIKLLTLREELEHLKLTEKFIVLL